MKKNLINALMGTAAVLAFAGALSFGTVAKADIVAGATAGNQTQVLAGATTGGVSLSTGGNKIVSIQGSSCTDGFGMAGVGGTWTDQRCIRKDGAVQGYQAGLISLDEARKALGLAMNMDFPSTSVAVAPAKPALPNYDGKWEQLPRWQQATIRKCKATWNHQTVPAAQCQK